MLDLPVIPRTTRRFGRLGRKVPAPRPGPGAPPAPASTPASGRDRQYYPSIFLSDLHLGTIGCQAAAVLDFLEAHEAGTLYLVGDIFDNWRPLGVEWPAAHERVLRLLLDRARSGCRIIYVPGNHDAFFRGYYGRYFDAVEVRADAWHETARGERLLVVHGDCTDVFARRLPGLARLGSLIEAGFRRISWAVNLGLGALRLGEWRLIEDSIGRINALIRARDRFEERLSDLARQRGADGIVCGHFHQPALHRDHGVLYANCGDWVEHCTALVETPDGRLDLVRWQAGAPESAAAVAPDAAGDAVAV